MKRVELYFVGNKIAKMFGVNYDHFMLTLDVIESPKELYECKRKGGCHNGSLIECVCWNNEHDSKISIEESMTERWHVAMVYGVVYEEAKLTKPYYVTNDRRCFDNIAVIVKVEKTHNMLKVPFTITDISERTVKNIDYDNTDLLSPAIRINNFNDLKDLFTPFWPKGIMIIIWFILFVLTWGAIFYKLI